MEKIRTTRSGSRTVACPTCGAAPGQPCTQPDPPSHAARHEAAVAAGAPRAARSDVSDAGARTVAASET